MKGIDRLHGIAEDVGRTVWLRDLGAALSDIADGIEGGTRDLGGYESDVLAWVEENGGLEAVKERTMPEDMEWPRYESGELVEIGDEVVGPDYGEQFKVSSVEFHANGFTLHDKNGFSKWYESDDRFERFSVIAADGEPLEAGQTVYHTDTGRECQIHSINDDGKGAFVYNNSLGQDAAGLHLCPVGNLTHQRPVLDADGVPIKKGDEVYLTDEAWVLSEVPSVKGEPLVVTHFKYNRERSVCAIDQFDIENGITVPWGLKPGWVTHTKPEPDSWSSVWADVSNGNESPEGMMRRCRALAGRGE